MNNKHQLNAVMVKEYRNWLIEQEKSWNTIKKYVRDINSFYVFLPVEKVVDKPHVMKWKEELTKRYAVGSVNSMLIAINGFLKYLDWNECCVKLLKSQRKMFYEQEKELTKLEYDELLNMAKEKGRHRLSMVIKTICATGIRVSELQFITVESVTAGKAEINCKGKRRTVFLPRKLCSQLIRYAHEQRLTEGHVFQTRSGRPLDRSNIWHDMKTLCELTGVNPSKVFPHNLRHLFARTFYTIDKDLAQLADILGHSSIETTRIYTVSSDIEHAKKIERLGLVK